MNPLIQLKTTSLPLLTALVLAYVALAPQAQAVCQKGCLTRDNAVLGDDALISNTTGDSNTAIGFEALSSNTTGGSNTANGAFALSYNTTGFENMATGYAALYRNTTGDSNTATGAFALSDNTTGFYNTANGFNALWKNTTGDDNTATGVSALENNTTGTQNTAVGSSALLSNFVGVANTAVGWRALQLNTGNGSSTAVGASALGNSTGFDNTALGTNAGVNLTDGVFNIDIGGEVVGVAGESNTIRIGTQGTQTKTFIAGISGASGTGTPVIINANGRLGTVPSSARFKEEIKPMDKASEAILALKPVMFRYKKEVDGERTPQFGLVAEQVEKVNPDLVARDDEGKPYTVRYEAVNAMLLNEFLKEHRKVQELEANAAKQQSNFAEQQKQIEALTAGLQKVSAQLEVSKAAPQTVSNK